MSAAVSRGMSRAFKMRSRACPKCGRKTIQPKSDGRYWIPQPFVCRWCPKEVASDKANPHEAAHD